MIRRFAIAGLAALPLWGWGLAPTALAQDCLRYERHLRWRAEAPAADYVRDLAFSPAGDLILAADDAAGLRIFAIGPGESLSLVGALDTPGRAIGVAAGDGIVCIADGDMGLRVIDVGDPANPLPLGDLDTPGWAEAVALLGDLAVVADGSAGLRVVDLVDPANPSTLSTLVLEGYATDLALVGDLAFVACAEAGLQIVDLADPANPVRLSSAVPSGSAWGVAVSGGLALLAMETGGARVVDVADVMNPRARGSLATPSAALACALTGDVAFVTDLAAGLLVVDLSDPDAPLLLGGMDSAGRARAVTVSGDRAAVADLEAGLHLLEVSHPTPAALRESVAGGAALDVDLFPGDLAVFAAGAAGLKVVDRSQDGDFQVVGSAATVDDALAVSEARGATLVSCGQGGVQLFDTSAFGDPWLLDAADTPGEARGGAAGDDFHHYVADGSAGIALLRIVGAEPADYSVVLDGQVACPGTPLRLARQGSTLFAAAGAGGLLAFDVLDPGSPVLVGTLPLVGEALALALADGRAYVACGEGGLQVVDVTDPASLQLISQTATPGAAAGLALHQGFLYVGDGGSGLQVYTADDAPLHIGGADTPGLAGAVAAVGNEIWVADGDGGLHVAWRHCDITPVLLDAFGLFVQPGAVTARWEGDGGADYRLEAERGGEAWTVPHAESAPGVFVARDEDPRLAAGGLVRYLLSGRLDGGPWLTLRDETLRLDGVGTPAAVLLDAFPNPCNPAATVAFATARAGRLRLSLHDVAGRQVGLLAEGEFAAGRHELIWRGEDAAGEPLPSGVYLLRLRGEGLAAGRKLVLLR